MRKSTSFALAIALLVVPACSLLADDELANPLGKPANFKEGGLTGYALWFEDGAWNLRMTSRGKKGKKKTVKAEFTGTVRLDKGKIAGEFQGLETGKNAKDSDWVRVHADRQGFDFHIITLGKTDSLRFKGSPGTEHITFKLLEGGDDEGHQVLIGAKGEKPTKMPFSLPAHPVGK